MPPRKDDGDLYVAKNNFALTLDGVPTVVARGDLVRAGHPILKGRADLFEPFSPKVRFDTKKVVHG